MTTRPRIRPCNAQDLPQIVSIINDAAQAYRGVIPADRWHEPYMPLDELKEAIGQGIVFWGCGAGEEAAGGALLGMMGIQDPGGDALIRHSFLGTAQGPQGSGESALD